MEEKLFDDFKRATSSDWSVLIERELKGKPPESLNWEVAGVKGKPFYTAEDLPGTLPNLSYIHEAREKFGDRHWVNYQVIKVTNEKNDNLKALFALDQGADGLLFQVETLPDFEVLLKDVLLPYCHIAFEIAGEGNELLQGFEHYVQTKNYPKEEIRGFIQCSNVVLSSLLPGFCASVVSEPLKDVKKELALLLAKSIDLIDQQAARPDQVEIILRQFQFRLTIGESYFIEIAKHRALRHLLVELAKSYGLSLENKDFKIMSVSGKWAEATKDEYNYLLRATTQAMSSIIGGTNALVVNPFSDLFPKNQAQAERIARNISTLLKDESYFDKIIDPSAGSYYIESVTQQVMTDSWALLQAIESKGGLNRLSESEVDALTSQTY